MIEIWQKLVLHQFICSVIEKISRLNVTKQNEKHRYIQSTMFSKFCRKKMVPKWDGGEVPLGGTYLLQWRTFCQM